MVSLTSKYFTRSPSEASLSNTIELWWYREYQLVHGAGTFHIEFADGVFEHHDIIEQCDSRPPFQPICTQDTSLPNAP